MSRLQKNFSPKVVLATMLIGTFMASVSQSMLTSALPAVMRDFTVDATLGQLLTTSYMYTLGIAAAFSAFLITRFNTRHLFLGALALFAAGCAAAYFAPSYHFLLAARLMQACGTGVLLPLVQVVALEIYPKEEYGHALGLVGLVFGFAPVAGPTLSGVLTDALGWRTIFMLLGLFAIVSLMASIFVVRDTGRHEKLNLHVPSMLLYTFGLIIFMAGVTGIEQFGFLDIRGTGTALVGVVMVVIFAVKQLHTECPYLRLQLFRNKVFRTGVVLLVVAQMATMSSALQVPLYLQEIHGYSATMSGLTLLPGALCQPFFNPITGRLYDRFGGKFVGLIGFALLIAGTGAFVFFTEQTPPYMVTLMYLLRMVGVAFVLMPMTAYSMTELPKEALRQGTAIVNSLRQVFGALGSSIMIDVVAQFSDASASSSSAGMSMHGFNVSFGVQAGLLFLSFMGTLLFVSGRFRLHHHGTFLRRAPVPIREEVDDLSDTLKNDLANNASESLSSSAKPASDSVKTVCDSDYSGSRTDKEMDCSSHK